MKAKVLSEKYQISYRVNGNDIIEDVEYKDAYWKAFLIAGTHRCPVSVQRITTVETPEEYKTSAFFSFLDDPGNTPNIITGSVTIDAEHFARDTKLSRYHPNNGWELPEYINDFEDAVFA